MAISNSMNLYVFAEESLVFACCFGFFLLIAENCIKGLFGVDHLSVWLSGSFASLYSLWVTWT